jgi:uncharacterized glyoxalase superfamily protein PhnB/uncharacterized protein YciI
MTLAVSFYDEMGPGGMAHAQEVYPRHVAYLEQFNVDGDVLMIGTFANPAVDGSMAVFRSREAAEQFIDGDPFVTEGVVARWRVLDWNGDAPATNRSAPLGPVIPVLSYANVQAATAWLVDVLGFQARVLVGPGHRAQLTFGEGSLIVADDGSDRVVPAPDAVTASVMLRVDDVAGVCERARRAGATVLSEPMSYPYGERQCTFRDPGGHVWTLTQTLTSTAPADWTGVEATI